MNRNDHEGQVLQRGDSRPLWIARGVRRLGWIQSAPRTCTEENASMKSLLIIAALVLMAVMSVASADAQDARLAAHIPFAFRVGSSTLPVGDYSLERVGQAQYVWLIRNDQGNPAVFALARIEGTNEEGGFAKLVFKRYGDTYFLSQIGCLGETYEVPASKAERQLKGDLARDNSKPESLYVLARLR